MVYSLDAGSGRRVCRWRSVAEKHQIVQLTMEPGASVAEIARAHGVNANQVFKWRRGLERGELIEWYSAWLPVTVSTSTERASEVVEPQRETSGSSAGAIHIELPGRALIVDQR